MTGLRARQGSLLVITLWMVATLSVMAVATARYLSTEVRLTKLRLAREQAKALARSGVYLAMKRLAQDAAGEADGKQYDWLGDDWAAEWKIPLPPGSLGVESLVMITDEERKLNLKNVTNGLHDPTFQAIASATILGDEELAKSLVDYIDADEQRVGTSQPPYLPKHAPPVTFEELSDIPKMTPEALKQLRSTTSLYDAGGEGLNINTVLPPVLTALGWPPVAVDLWMTSRERNPVDDKTRILSDLMSRTGLDTAQANLLLSDLFDVVSQTFTVRSTGVAGVSAAVPGRSPIRYTVEAVVTRSSHGVTSGSPTIVGWTEG